MENIYTACAEANLLLITELAVEDEKILNKFSSGWNSKTPLFVAIENNQFEAVKLLFSLGADINLVSSWGKSALSVACEVNNFKVASFLLEHNASANPVSAWSGYPTSHNPLSIAIKNGNFELAETLLEYGAYIDGGFITPLQQAAYNNNILAAEFLLANDADIDYSNLLIGVQISPAIVIAAANSNIEMVQWLIEHGANVNTYIELREDAEQGELYYPISKAWSSSALYNAIESGNIAIINLLLDSGAGQAEGLSDLHISVLRNDIYTMRQLLEAGADVDELNILGESSLHYALYLNNVEALEVLGEYNANINYSVPCFFDDKHPIEIAIYSHSKESVEWLLKNNIDIEQSYEFGESALQIAAGMGYVDIASILIKYGADIGHLDEDGNSVLQTSIYGDEPHMLILLLENGADINHQNDEGQTVLHSIISEISYVDSSLQLLKVLLDNNANLDIKDYSGCSPLDCFLEQSDTFNSEFDANLMFELLSGTLENESTNVLGLESISDDKLHASILTEDNLNTENILGMDAQLNKNIEISEQVKFEDNNYSPDVYHFIAGEEFWG